MVTHTGPMWVMGTSGRVGIGSGEAGPGPGAYKYYDTLKEGRGITMGARTPEKIRSDVPGPGTYDPRSSIGEGPAYK